jgi:hypothetical protein
MPGKSRGDTMGGADLSPKQRRGAVRRRRQEKRTARQVREFWGVFGLLDQQRERERAKRERADRGDD